MKPEPLKGKIGQDDYGDEFLTPTSVNSAFEWMIQIHEEKIEELIEWIEDHELNRHSYLISVYGNDDKLYFTDREKMFERIDREYESIMILQAGLEDVI